MRLSLIASFVVLTCCGVPEQEETSALSSLANSMAFPLAPDPQVTPGSLCTEADEYRYPERINYCARNVDTATKKKIKGEYEKKLGYKISQLRGARFKIDHYISLCMGGSNSISNLWPQHESIYALTDPVEAKLCHLLADGRIAQAEAIETIKLVKNNLSKLSEVNGRLDKVLR